MSAKKFIRDTFLRLFRRRPTLPIKKAARVFDRRLEMLEDRLNPVISLSFAAGVATFTSDSASDTLQVQATSNPADILYNSGGIGLASLPGITQLIFNGQGGNDIFAIQSPTGTHFAPVGGIQYNAGGQAADELDFIGGASTWTGSYNPTGPNAGSISFTNTPGTLTQTTTFTGLGVLRNSNNGTMLNVNTPGSNDTINVFTGPNLGNIAVVQQGPVLIDGGDRDDHGSFGSGGTVQGFYNASTATDFSQNLETGGWNVNNNVNITNSTSVPHVSVTGSGNGTVDFYRFLPTADGATVTLDIDNTGGGFNSLIAIYDDQGNVIASNDNSSPADAGSVTTNDSFLTVTLGHADTYYIGVGKSGDTILTGGFSTGSGITAGFTYTLNVSVDFHAASAGSDPVTEVEPNQGTFTLPAANLNGWQYIQQGVNFVNQNAFNSAPANSVLAIGLTGYSAGGTQAGKALFNVASVLGLTVTPVTGAAITAANFNNFRVIYVPSDVNDTIGGISSADLALLNARTNDIRDFINAGGGIFALTEAGFPSQAYGWLQIPNAFTISTTVPGGGQDPLRKTPAAIAAGLTVSDSALTAGTPYHNIFTAPVGFNNLLPFVLNNGPNGVLDGMPASYGYSPPFGDDQVVALGLGAIHNTGLGGAGPSTAISFNGDFLQIFVSATTGLTLDGQGGNDTYNIQSGTPVITNIAIKDTGGGTDGAFIWGSSGADQWNVNSTTAQTIYLGIPTIQTFTYTDNLEALTINGPANPGDPVPTAPTATDVGDTFRVKPDANTAFTINGGNPYIGYGDTLILNALGLTNAVVSPLPPGTSRPNGQLASANRKTVTWTSIESLPVPLGLGATLDFGPTADLNDPNTQFGFLPVLPTDTPTNGQWAFAGLGWTSPGMGAFNRVTQFGAAGEAYSPQLAALLRDAEWGYGGGGANNGQLQMTVAPNQDVLVTALIGDTFQNRDSINVYVSTTPTGPATKLNPSLTTFNVSSSPDQFASYSGVFNPGNNTTLYFTIEKVNAGPSGFWVLNGLDVRPLGLISPLYVVKTGGNATVVADGLSVDSYTNVPNTGALPFSELTISPQYGTPYGTDYDPVMKGFQVLADVNGAYSFQVLRSTGLGPATLTVTDVTGASGTGFIGPTATPSGFGAPAGTPSGYSLPSQYQQSYSLPTVRRLDFGPTGQVVGSDSVVGNPNYLGWGSTSYVSTVANALGWVGVAPSTVDRGAGSAVQRDFAWNYAGSGSDGDYELDFPIANANSPYVVTVQLGDQLNGHDSLFVQVIDPNTGLPTATPVVGLTVPAGQTASITIPVMTDATGRIRLRFGSSSGATDAAWTLQSIDARPAAGSVVAGAQGVLTVNGTTYVPPGPTALSGSPAADGTTTTNYSISGATPFAVLTVSSTLGTFTTTDGATTYTGFQVVANNLGAASFTIQSPASTSNVTGTITVTETTGTKVGVFSQNYTGASPPAVPPGTAIQRFDFNAASSNATAAGFTGVLTSDAYNATRGYGWMSQVADYDRVDSNNVPQGGTPVDLYRDGAWGYKQGVFGVSAPAGATRDVRVYVGDQFKPWPGITFTAEGGSTAAYDPAPGRYSYVTLSGTNNSDGVFTITVNVPGDRDVFVISGLDIAATGALPAPASPSAAIPPGGRRLDFNSTPTDTAPGFTNVVPNLQYTAATGYGWAQSVGDFSRDATSLPVTMTAAQKSLYRDGAWFGNNSPGLFLIGVTPLGQGSIRAYVGDSYNFWQGETISIEGGPAVSVTTNFSSYVLTGNDVNGDGLLVVTISAPTWVINGIDIVSGGAGGLPAPL